MPDRDRRKQLVEMLDKAPAAPWVREMQEHYERTGTYRSKDIRRVVGDQTEGVKMTSDPTPSVLKLDR
jgi:hypothetical protein